MNATLGGLVRDGDFLEQLRNVECVGYSPGLFLGLWDYLGKGCYLGHGIGWNFTCEKDRELKV